MPKYLFTSHCLACGDRKIISWRHDSKKCGGAYYIDEDLYLHCNKCNDKTFLFNATFDCGKHDSRKPSMVHVMKALTFLQISSDIPEDIFDEMLDKANHYRHRHY